MDALICLQYVCNVVSLIEILCIYSLKGLI